MAGEIVVDAFSGIGYYTLPMLVRSNAKHVYACELNPNSINALTKGAELNVVSDRLTIIEGDNQITLQRLTGIADRVHLGILPSSENTWPSALDCLKKSGGIIHIHMNVREKEIDSFVEYCLEQIKHYAAQRDFNTIQLKHVEKVKWYAPHIRHIVIDVSIS
jgi:tRNA wybutosine-synthesizing protein 3